MSTRKEAVKEAKDLRKRYPNLTVNVKEISKGNWGVRFSPKGIRDKWDTENERPKIPRISGRTPRITPKKARIC